MRLGGTVFYNGKDPEEYALAHVAKGFKAAVCPGWLSMERPEEIEAFKAAMKKHDIRIAEDRTSFGRGQIIQRLDNGVLVGGCESRTDSNIACY